MKNKQRLSQKEFIERSEKIHINKYNYSKVEYVNSKSLIIIICPIHGDFELTPDSHLQNCGCSKCSGHLCDTNLFVQKVYEKFPKYIDRYDYSPTIYVKSNQKVEIICKLCNKIFTQTPANHLYGFGCNRCSSQYSKCQIKWIKFLEVYFGVEIKHAENDGEYKIANTKYRADGYCQETNTIFEYHGDFWHGNPKVFNHNEINPRTKCSYGELYEKTIEKEKKLKQLGYNIISIWEYDWKRFLKMISKIQKKYKKPKK